MATILPFAQPQDRRKRGELPAAAQIVIFPGVRVTYHDASAPAPTGKEPSGAGRKRKAAKGALTA